MRKDYTAVSGDEATLGDAQFLDKFWTDVFAGKELSKDFLRKMEKRDESLVLRPYLSGIPQGGAILDGGCGLGDWTVFLARQGFKVTGLDISSKIVARLRLKFPGDDFRVGDIRKLDFADAALDAYFSWGTFEHFENGFADPVLEARRVLKKGGFLFISVPFHNRRLQSRPYVPDTGAGSRFYQWRLSKDELRHELETRGFQVLEVRPIHKWHGVYRMVRHDIGVDPDSFMGKVCRAVFYPFVPSDYVAHMIMAVARKN